MTANQIKWAELKESGRHNRETESQGRTMLNETRRHNVASEGISRSQVGVQAAQVAEMRRHNVSTEGIDWYNAQTLGTLRSAQSDKLLSEVGVEQGRLDETKRHNIELESQGQSSINETRRHNQANEFLNSQDLSRRIEEYRESARHNLETEEDTDVANFIRGVQGLIQGAGGIAALVP